MGSQAGRSDAVRRSDGARCIDHFGIWRKDSTQQCAHGHYGQALDALVRLKPAIDAFFAAVMVNADDQAVRSNRLSLLQEVDDFFNSFADFSQIVVQGS